MKKLDKNKFFRKIVSVNSLNFLEEPYILQTFINGLLIVRRPIYSDGRGSFQEQYRVTDIAKSFKNTKISQSQISVSKPNVLRGIHAEPRDKFITPLTGRMTAIIVDLRKNSPTLGEWAGFEFDNTSFDTPRTSLFVPGRCGNSFCVYKKDSDPNDGLMLYQYTYSTTYDPKWSKYGVRYDDPDLSIKWPIKNPIISDRDKNLPTFKEFLSFSEF